MDFLAPLTPHARQPAPSPQPFPALCKFLSHLRPAALTVNCHVSHTQVKQGSPIPKYDGNEEDAPPTSFAINTGSLSCVWKPEKGLVPTPRNQSWDKACGTTCNIPKFTLNAGTCHVLTNKTHSG